jgi:hypothetical protein
MCGRDYLDAAGFRGRGRWCPIRSHPRSTFRRPAERLGGCAGHFAATQSAQSLALGAFALARCRRSAGRELRNQPATTSVAVPGEFAMRRLSGEGCRDAYLAAVGSASDAPLSFCTLRDGRRECPCVREGLMGRSSHCAIHLHHTSEIRLEGVEGHLTRYGARRGACRAWCHRF